MIAHAVADSFFLEVLRAIHAPQDTYRIALYTEAALLSYETTAYTRKGEVRGPGYVAGGLALPRTEAFEDGAAVLRFAEAVWPDSTITAHGALIYNATKQNRAVAVLDFGRNLCNPICAGICAASDGTSDPHAHHISIATGPGHHTLDVRAVLGAVQCSSLRSDR